MNKNKKQLETEKEVSILQETDPNTAQGFLPFDDLVQNYIKVGNEYRAIIDVSSINYNLLSQSERELLESQFKSMIDSMKYCFAFHIQTRQIDPREMIDIMSNNVNELRTTMPVAVNYGRQFLEEFRQFEQTSIIIKKKYIIITSDPITTAEISEEDKQMISFEQLEQRSISILGQLRGMKLQGRILTIEEILELLKLSIGKVTGGSVDGLTSGDFLTYLVSGKDEKQYESSAEKIDILMKEFENRIELEVINDPNISENRKDRMIKLLKDIQFLRQKYAGVTDEFTTGDKYFENSTFRTNKTNTYNSNKNIILDQKKIFKPNTDIKSVYDNKKIKGVDTKPISKPLNTNSQETMRKIFKPNVNNTMSDDEFDL